MPNTKIRYLTKSRFKEALSCPNKLYYSGKKEYPNSNSEDTFLRALAEGGFQVGELAKLYHPGGVEIETLDKETAAQQTKKHLEKDTITLFEPAITWNSCLIRIDVLEKKKSTFILKEVKAKSFDSATQNTDSLYSNAGKKKGQFKLKSEWFEYVYDIAFQTYILSKAYPGTTIISKLVFADKSKPASADGLNQFFLLESENGRTTSKVKSGITYKDLGEPILCEIDVTEVVQRILTSPYLLEIEDTLEKKISFSELVRELQEAYNIDQKLNYSIGSQCKNCEYRVDTNELESNQRSGFNECWKEQVALSDADLNEPLVIDIWNFRKSDDLIDSKIYFMRDVGEKDISPKPHKNGLGFSYSERQWLQVESVKKKSKPTILTEDLNSVLKTLKYPLHFIDFETTRVAIPFHKGRLPYEQIAFQFSHHTLSKDGELKHQTQFISTERGKFPNFEFVRALKEALGKDSGTIFRYATHENSVLRDILKQLSESKEKDRDELCSFIESLTENKSPDGKSTQKSKRAMVDLKQLVVQYYFNPLTNGSNSLKDVLPAILKTSKLLKTIYSKPVHSLNNPKHIWIKEDETGNIIDPYQQLPPVFPQNEHQELTRVYSEEQIRDGAAAMTAYGRMQFSEMSDKERKHISDALLRYCELDTLAMVMLFQHFEEILINYRR